MKYLIVSADDFGLAETVNKGIVKAYKDGIVTCVNIMPTGVAFEDAIQLTEMIGLKEIGAHLALTQTEPLMEASKVPTLLAANGGFHQNYINFFLRYILGKIDLDQVYLELKKQINALQMTGLKITNLNSHEHIHMAPAILDIFVELAKEYRIPAIRFPRKEMSFYFDINKFYRTIILSFFEKPMKKILSASAISSPDYFRGFLHAGNLKEDIVLRIIDSVEEGTTELVCHPAIARPEVSQKYKFNKNGELELSALTSDNVKTLINNNEIRLVSYGEFLLIN